MQQDIPRDPRRPTRANAPAPDDETSAELSRAAREAVRQPPDPRLEKQFAYLGLWGESEPGAPGAGPPGDPSSETGESARVHEALAALQERSAGLEARLDIVLRQLALMVRLLVVLTVVVVGLAVLVLARSLA